MPHTHDIIIIGAGSGGLNVAGFMNKAGFKVLLIDKDEKSIGGDCLNYGCVPSKALIHVARQFYSADIAKSFGLRVAGKANLKHVMDYVKEKQKAIREHENPEHFKKLGMDVVLGKASFVSHDTVKVSKKEYSAKKIILATGSRPRIPDIEGLDKADFLTNEDIFNLGQLPRKLLVIGGGPIGIELGQAFAMLGSKVTVVQRGDMFLPKESKEIADILRKELEEQGISIMFDSEPKKFLSDDEAIIKSKDGKETKVEFDKVLLSVGRVLNTEGLELKKAGIELDEKGKIKIDGYLRTTNHDVLLCGDIVGSYQFTHAAEMHAAVIINNFFSPFKKKIDYDKLSWVTYTTPEISTFGLDEQQLKKRDVGYEKLSLDFEDDDRAIVDNATYGKLNLFISNYKIIGGSMVAKDAGELSQELILAMSSGLNIKEIFSKTYPYPVASRANKKIISKYFSKRLTPFAKTIMRWLY